MTLGTAAVLSTGWCLDAVGGPFDEPMHLARFGAFNDDSDPHTFEVRVDRDREVVHQSTHRIQGRDNDRIHSESTDYGWGTARGNDEIFARVDTVEWIGKALTDVTDDWRNTLKGATAEAWFEDKMSILLADDCDTLARGHWDGAWPLEYSDRWRWPAFDTGPQSRRLATAGSRGVRRRPATRRCAGCRARSTRRPR